MIIQISAGQGPAECQLAVAKLFGALKKEFGDLEIISETKGQEKGCLNSIRFRTEHDLIGLVRGNPVRTYEGERFLLKERKDGGSGQAAPSGSTR